MQCVNAQNYGFPLQSKPGNSRNLINGQSDLFGNPFSALPQHFFSPVSIYVVNSALDTSDAAPGNNVCDDGMGRCTLRAAIQEANAHAGADTINFSIASGLQTINAASDLPIITEPVTLDATTQPGYAGAPIIQVAGVSSAFGFDVTGGNTIIKGFVLNRWNTAIQFDVNGGNVVENCCIGTDSNGSIAVANQDGIVVRSNNNRIGGTSAANASISGRVATADGRGIRNARLVLTDAFGQSREAQTGSFGYFRFVDVPVGQTYILTVRAKRFTFSQPSQVISLNDDLTDANFTSEP